MVYIITLLGALILIMPLLWMLLTSFKPFGETLLTPPTIIPNQPTFDNYIEVLDDLPMLVLTVNTVLTIICAVAGAIVMCSLAAFALAYLDVPFGKLYMLSIISLSMVPGEVLILPIYNIMNRLGLVNTLAAIYIPHALYTLGVLLLYQAFKSIPASFIESARLDGASWFRIYRKVAMPLVKSTLTSLSIIVALNVWKELLWIIIVNQDLDKMTLGAGISRLGGAAMTQYNLIMAADVIAIIPMIIVFLFLQKQFMQTAVDSGVK